MNKQVMVSALIVLLMGAFVIETVEGSMQLARLAKLYFIARAFRHKKIFLPLPLPLPIPLFKENVHHQAVPVHHHTKAVVGYGLEQPHGGGGGGGGHDGGHGGWY